MVFPDFDPVIFQIGPLAIRWYALAYIAGILLGWWYVTRIARREALWGARAPVANRDQIDDLVLWVTVGVIVGGRLGYMLFYNTSALWREPLEILRIWEGGMSFHGGLVGVIVAFFLVARLHKLDVLKLSDLAAPAVPIGLFFGRIANFVNAELWGRETYAPWGVVFCNDGIMDRHGGVCPAGLEPRHPSQLYEAGLEGLLLFVILWFAAFHGGQLRRRGALTGLFLIGYSIFRMLVETVREPDAHLQGWPFGLTMGMVLSLPMLLGGLWLFLRSRGPKGEASAFVEPAVARGGEATQPAIDDLAAAQMVGGLEDDNGDAAAAATTAGAAATVKKTKPKPPPAPKVPPAPEPPGKPSAGKARPKPAK